MLVLSKLPLASSLLMVRGMCLMKSPASASRSLTRRSRRARKALLSCAGRKPEPASDVPQLQRQSFQQESWFVGLALVLQWCPDPSVWSTLWCNLWSSMCWHNAWP